MIEDLADHNLTEEPFLIPWSSAKQIIKKIEAFSSLRKAIRGCPGLSCLHAAPE